MGFKVYLLLSALIIIISTVLIIYQNAAAEKVNSLKPFSIERITETAPVAAVSAAANNSTAKNKTSKDSILKAQNILQNKRKSTSIPKINGTNNNEGLENFNENIRKHGIDEPSTIAVSKTKSRPEDSIPPLISYNLPSNISLSNQSDDKKTTGPLIDSEIKLPSLSPIIKINDKISNKLPPWKLT